MVNVRHCNSKQYVACEMTSSVAQVFHDGKHLGFFYFGFGRKTETDLGIMKYSTK